MMQPLRVITFVIMTLVVPVKVLTAQTTAKSPQFTITISAPKPEVALGAEIQIWMEVTNISDHPILVPFGRHGNVSDGFQYIVRDEQGTPVPKFGARYVERPDGDKLQLPSKPPGSSIPGGIELGAGKSMESDTRISDLYPFDHPGKYTIQVSRGAVKKVGVDTHAEGTVFSNTITITVLPAGATPPAEQ